MTPRDVREKMILSQMVGVEQKEALEAQEREKAELHILIIQTPTSQILQVQSQIRAS